MHETFLRSPQQKLEPALRLKGTLAENVYEAFNKGRASGVRAMSNEVSRRSSELALMVCHVSTSHHHPHLLTSHAHITTKIFTTSHDHHIAASPVRIITTSQHQHIISSPLSCFASDNADELCAVELLRHGDSCL